MSYAYAENLRHYYVAPLWDSRNCNHSRHLASDFFMLMEHRLRDSVWQQRSQFTVDANVDELIRFF
jgi:hypothetical protein